MPRKLFVSSVAGLALLASLSLGSFAAAQDIFTTEDFRQDRAHWTDPVYYPILKPWAAEIVKRHGELIRVGELAPDAHASCSPNGLPYALILRGNVHLLQEPDKVTIIYDNDNQIRTVYLNREHSDEVSPSYYGESVGWYEGDTLVVDTVGIRRTQFSAIDRFGTPHTDELHVIERYRVIEVNGGAALRIDVIVEDPGTFNMPWGGYMVYYDNNDNWWEEGICAENNRSGVWMPTEENYERQF